MNWNFKFWPRRKKTFKEMTQDRASTMLDRLIDAQMANPNALRQPATGKRSAQREPRPTMVEQLAVIAYPDEEKLPRRERSPRGKRKEAGRQRAVARMKDYASRLAEYRKIPGVPNLAKKLPYPTWPAEQEASNATRA